MASRIGNKILHKVATILVLVNCIIVALSFIYVLIVGGKILASVDMGLVASLVFLALITTLIFFSMFMGKSPDVEERISKAK